MTDWRYEVITPVLLRLATRPTAASGSTVVDLDPADPDRTDDLVAYLLNQWSDQSLREAVHVSSPPLAHRLDRIAAGHRPDRRALRRAVLALTRYALRASTRPTPFGLLAGVAAAEFGDDAKVRIGTRHSRSASADLGWLLPLVRELEQRPAVRAGLRLATNNLCRVRGDRVTLDYVQHSEEQGLAPAEISVRRTAVVDHVLEAARRPVRHAELVDRITEAFPGAAAERIDRFLAELVAQDILLTDLRPDPQSADPLGDVLARLPDAVEECAALRRIRVLLDRYAGAPPGAGTAPLLALTGEMTRVRATDRPVHVDLRVDADVRLPRTVADEAAHAVEVLARLSLPDPVPEHLLRYRAEFVERYGDGALVPLTELLDPERGLGPPSGYTRPAGARHVEHRPPVPGRERALVSLAADALRDDTTEIVLDDDLVRRLAEPSDAPPQRFVELYANLLAGSVADLDAGRFRLVLTDMSGYRGHVGATWGRFLPMLPEVAAPLAARIRADADPARAAELVTHVSVARLANVARTPPLVDTRIPVGILHDPADPAILPLEDLLVGADDTGLFLRSARDGTPVSPVAPHMLSEHVIGGNEARFLRELGHAGHRHWLRWRWGSAEHLPRQPRVTIGRTVVASATWRPDPRLGDRALPWADWRHLFDRWRQRWGVPSRVQAVRMDHRVDLDLDSVLHLHLLHDQFLSDPATILREPPTAAAPPGVDGWGWSDGHAVELVVTAVSRARPERTTPAAGRTGPREPHLPGGGWTYAKLYASRARHDDLLTGYLPALVESARQAGADRWFFIRYADPQPHLRIRLRGPARDLVPVLHDWAEPVCRAGLASGLVLDGYLPEYARYGGTTAMPLAEAVFEADSEAVLSTLAHRAALPTTLLAAAGVVDIAAAFIGTGWEEWLLSTFKVGAHHAGFRATREQALRIVDPYGGWAALRESGVPVEPWHLRGAALHAYAGRLRAAGTPLEPIAISLLHMHHNRLLGIDPDSEQLTGAIARGSVQAHVDRRRHTGGSR